MVEDMRLLISLYFNNTFIYRDTQKPTNEGEIGGGGVLSEVPVKVLLSM